MTEPTNKTTDAPNKSPVESRVQLWTLFFIFAKIGLFTFGGGLAMLPLIQKAVVDDKGWMGQEEFTEMLAVTNALPGAFAINAAVYIGYEKRRLPGAVTAAVGTMLPSFVVILIVAYLLLRGQGIEWLEKFFLGVRPVVVALLIDSAFKLGGKTIKRRADVILLLIGTILIAFTGVNAALIILAGGLVGLTYYRRKMQQAASEPDDQEVE